MVPKLWQLTSANLSALGGDESLIENRFFHRGGRGGPQRVVKANRSGTIHVQSTEPDNCERILSAMWSRVSGSKSLP